MSKEKVIEYVMNSPYNTNKAVLKRLLDDISEEEWTTLFEEEATTAHAENLSEGIYIGGLNYSNFINADTIKITFDGIEYECNATEYASQFMYGATVNEEENIDFSEYPFVLDSISDEGNIIITSTPGVHTIKVETPKESEGSSSDWSTAVVTFLNTSMTGEYTVECCTILDNNLKISTLHVSPSVGTDKLIIPGSYTATIPIYKNQYLLYTANINDIESDETIQYSGDISRNNDCFIISGNGSITAEGTHQES